jgi:hypothetical protein
MPSLIVTVHWGQGEDEPRCLISSLPATQQQPHLVYERRFWIETLFGSCKSCGLGLARTHLTDPELIDRLNLAIAIATRLTFGPRTHLVLSNTPCTS